jgi:hypothetical protein
MVEIVVGLFVFLASFIAAIGVFGSTRAALSQSRNVTMATHLAEKIMEDQLAQGFGALAGASGGREQLSTVTNGTATTLTFDYAVLVSNVNPNLRDVQVVVKWQDGDIPRQVSLESMVANF